MSGSRVLVVDDEPSNVRLLEHILTRTGFTQVTSTSDSRQALPLYRQLSADIVLLDLVMPQPDGMTILRRIREDSALGGSVPIVVLTADTSRETRLQALAAGATDFVTKPFDATEVRLRVGNLLEVRRLQKQLEAQNEQLEDMVRERTRELLEAYERERQAGERLRALQEVKDSFLVAVSHEIRTPLSVVLGVAGTLERNLDRLPLERTRDLVARLSAGGRRLDRLLSSLLDADRVRRGLAEPMRRTTGLRPLVVRVLADIDLKARSLEVRVDDASVEIDPAQVERILEHLLSNAVRHTPPGTSVTLSMTHTADALDIAVDDDGPGVPDELKARVFERFAQGDVPEHSPGLGLGLNLVLQFAQLHGGLAWVEDRRGGGSSFRVRLPAAPAADEGGTSSRSTFPRSPG